MFTNSKAVHALTHTRAARAWKLGCPPTSIPLQPVSQRNAPAHPPGPLVRAPRSCSRARGCRQSRGARCSPGWEGRTWPAHGAACVCVCVEGPHARGTPWGGRCKEMARGSLLASPGANLTTACRSLEQSMQLTSWGLGAPGPHLQLARCQPTSCSCPRWGGLLAGMCRALHPNAGEVACNR